LADARLKMAECSKFGRSVPEKADFIHGHISSALDTDKLNLLTGLSPTPEFYDPNLIINGTSPKCMLPTILEDAPVFVNARQYERILKRRIARSKQQKAAQKEAKTYVHESRHRHACNRKRGPTGVFLPKQTEEKPKKKTKYSRYSAACVLYGMQPED
jgi:hypothetical protein